MTPQNLRETLFSRATNPQLIMSNAHRIACDDITLGRKIDQGGYAEVLEGTRKGGSQVAVKRMFDGLSQQSNAAFQLEVAMMCQLRSDFCRRRARPCGRAVQ
jgi:hypothetical protein